MPAEYKALAILVSRYHLHCHRVFELKPSTLLTTLERLDAFRKPERFEKFLLACEADAKGRTGFEQISYLQAQKMREAYKAAKTADIQSVVGKGFEGEVLKNKIHQIRVAAITQSGTV